MSRISRRQCAGLAAGAAAALSAPAVFASAPPTRMRVGMLPILDFAALFAAHSQGYFLAERLDVVLTGSRGGAPGFESLIAGDLEACISTTNTALVLAEKGIRCPLIGCGASVGKGPPQDVCALLVRADGHINGAKDLKGKRVAVNDLDAAPWLCARIWTDTHGGDSAGINFAEVPFPQMGDALLNNRVDAIVLVEPLITALMHAQAGKTKILAWVFSAALPGSLISGVFASETYIKKHHTAIAGFSHAYNRGVLWIKQNFGKPPLYQLISGYSKAPVALLEKVSGWPIYETKVAPDVFLPLAKAMLRYKLLPHMPRHVNELVFSDIRA